MRIAEFERLSEEEKRVMIFEAAKISERTDNGHKYELFQIDEFYVEVKTSLLLNSKRQIHTYSPGNLPVEYQNYIPVSGFLQPYFL